MDSKIKQIYHEVEHGQIKSTGSMWLTGDILQPTDWDNLQANEYHNAVRSAFGRILLLQLSKVHGTRVALLDAAQPMMQQRFKEHDVFQVVEGFDPLEHVAGSSQQR